MNQNEQSRVTVIVDGKQGINELGKLEMQASDLREQIKKLKTGTDEYVKANEKLDKVKSEMAGLRQEIGLSGLTMNQLNKYQLDLSREINNTVTKGTERYNELKAKLIEVRGVIQGQKDDIRGVAKVSEAAAGSIKALKDEAAKLDAEMELLGGDTAEFAAKAAQLQQVKTQLNDLTNAAKGIEKAVTPAAGSIKALKDEAAKLDAELQLLEADTAEFTAKASQLQQVDARLKAATSAAKGLEVAQEGATGSMARLKAQAAALEKELSLLAPDTAAFANKLKELKAVEGQIGSVQNKMSGLSGAWKEFKSGALSMAGGVIGGNLMLMAAQKLADFIPNLINSQSKLSDSLADLRKTTGMSADEVKEFNKQLSKIDTRTPTEELRKIAIVAGQLGIAKKDILGFTTSVDRLVVALGDEFQGGAEEITKQVGALRNIFADIKSDNVSEDMLHIGNALNQLGAEGAATGPVMSDMASRIGGVGITLGLTSGQVLGLSATMQELNITSERGSTAVTKILQKMASAPDEFSKAANMSAQKFKELVDNDIYGALVKVVTEANKTGASATALAAILKELDVDGAGASEVFAKLGSNTELLAKKVNSATSALKGTDSIMNEFNIKNETFAAKLEKVGKFLMKLVQSHPLVIGIAGAVQLLVDGIYKLIPAAEKQSEVMQREFQSFKGVSAEVLSLNVGNKRRVELINELKEAYPEYLGQINAETASNQELKKALDNINDALVKKIVTQKAGEKLQEQLKIEADLLLDLGQKNIVLRDAMTLMYEQGGRGAYQSVRLLEMQDEMKKKSIDFSQQLLIVETEAADGRIKGISATNPYLQSAKKRLEEAQIAELKYMKAKEQSNALDKERVALLKAMGIKDKVDEKSTADLDAARKIRDAKIALLKDEYEQKRQKLQAAAADEKVNFQKTKASAGQIAEYKILVEAKLNQDLIKLAHEKDRVIRDKEISLIADEYAQKESQMREAAQREITDFVGTADQIAEHKKLVDAKLNQDLIKLAQEKDRTIKDVELSLLGDTLRGKQQKLIEQATRDIKDFVGTADQKAAYASAIEDKLMKDLADADAEYRKKDLEEEEKLQKDKVEAAKKAKQQELDDAIASEELMVLLTEKVNGSEKRGKYIMQELENQRKQELANVNLTEEQKQAIEQRYDKAKRAYSVYKDTSSLNARIALLTAQMQKELALHEGNEKKQAEITAKYLGEIAILRLQEQQRVAQQITSYIQAASEIAGQFEALYSQKIDNQIADLQATKSEEDKAFDAKKQQIDEVSAKEEAAKNKRVDLAAAERDKKLALYESEYKKKKMTEAQYNNLRKQAEKEYNELKDAEDAKTGKAKADREFLYNQEKQKAEDEYNNKVRELKAKQWRAEQNTKRTQAFMEGAVGVINALAVGDYARAALVTIKTALGIALINSQQMPAFAEGGSTGAPIASGGMITKPYLATVAEKGEEYVIPNWQLQVPAVANIVRMLEVMRVNKSTTLPLNEITGNTTNGTGNVGINGNNSNELLIPLLIKMDSTLDKIQQRLDNPKKVEAYLEFQKFDDDYTFAKETKESANA